uniref:Secreted protein n=1 Tax=Ixodes ricinus TaxID=34613 RepID=A0A090XDY2_IXORI
MLHCRAWAVALIALLVLSVASAAKRYPAVRAQRTLRTPECHRRPSQASPETSQSTSSGIQAFRAPTRALRISTGVPGKLRMIIRTARSNEASHNGVTRKVPLQTPANQRGAHPAQ